MEKRIGKIKRFEFGFGGYQDAQFGVSVALGSDKECWGVSDFRGHWGIDRSSGSKWTEEDREIELGKMCMWVRDLMNSAKKTSIDQMVGIPVEVTFDGNALKEWRVLIEVI